MAMTAAGNDIGKGAILFYLLVYGLTSVGAFGVTALVASRDRTNDDLSDYAGLAAAPAAAGPAVDDLPSLARRLSADRRVYRQVVPVQRRRHGR